MHRPVIYTFYSGLGVHDNLLYVNLPKLDVAGSFHSGFCVLGWMGYSTQYNVCLL